MAVSYKTTQKNKRLDEFKPDKIEEIKELEGKEE